VPDAGTEIGRDLRGFESSEGGLFSALEGKTTCWADVEMQRESSVVV